MRKLFSVGIIISLVLLADTLVAETIRNWAAPGTWTPRAATGAAKAGVKTSLATTYNALPFIPVSPCRLADTRGNGFTGEFGPPAITGGGTQRTFTITGQCGIPAGAAAVSFNFAVWVPVTRGDLRVFPSGGGTPTVSTMNWEAGILALANAAVMPLGTGGAITVQVDGSGTVNIFFDVNGYYSSDVSTASSADLSLSSTGSNTLYAVNSAAGGTTIEAIATGTGDSWAVYGEAHGSGPAVYGYNNSTGTGVRGLGITGMGVYGTSNSDVGVKGLSADSDGVWAESANWDGLYAKGGQNGAYMTGVGIGGTGVSTGATGTRFGLVGLVSSVDVGSTGVLGMATGGWPANWSLNLGLMGVLGLATESYGVVGVSNPVGYAGMFISQHATTGALQTKALLAPSSVSSGWFYGNVMIYDGPGGGPGDLHVTGVLSKGSGTFKIDHPLDPENKYLYHSFVESPDMMNIYNGLVQLDATGEAIVTLPAYFEALNKDFRYQLTSIGRSQPDLHVADEIRNLQFRIAGGKPHAKVSWQVTGVRQDPFANANRVIPEVEKEEEARGFYLHPAAYKQRGDRDLGHRMTEVQKTREIERARNQSQ